ncbi:MAG: hypothetical protein M1812_005664 [Candelaria pacifica]|nr:MAG: hypothetical protein M1812_005664 [Candelaria pacifica]
MAAGNARTYTDSLGTVNRAQQYQHTPEENMMASNNKEYPAPANNAAAACGVQNSATESIRDIEDPGSSINDSTAQLPSSHLQQNMGTVDSSVKESSSLSVVGKQPTAVNQLFPRVVIEQPQTALTETRYTENKSTSRPYHKRKRSVPSSEKPQMSGNASSRHEAKRQTIEKEKEESVAGKPPVDDLPKARTEEARSSIAPRSEARTGFQDSNSKPDPSVDFTELKEVPYSHSPYTSERDPQVWVRNSEGRKEQWVDAVLSQAPVEFFDDVEVVSGIQDIESIRFRISALYVPFHEWSSTVRKRQSAEGYKLILNIIDEELTKAEEKMRQHPHVSHIGERVMVEIEPKRR